jgi:hypothetical protein
MVLVSIPASGIVVSEGRQMKQCCIKYFKKCENPLKKYTKFVVGISNEYYFSIMFSLFIAIMIAHYRLT